MAADIDSTIAFWKDCFDADVVGDESMAGSRNVFLDIGGGRLNLYDTPPNHRGPVHHLGVHVTDLADTVNRLEKAGWEPRPITHHGPLSYSMVQGPDGLLLEVFHFDSQTTPEHLRPYFDLPPGADASGVVASPGAESDFLGTGSLSPQAIERLNRPKVDPLRPPAADDHGAVAQWRAAIHRAWLEGDPAPEECGHHRSVIGGVDCLIAGEAPADDPNRPLVVYFHGGGYCLGSTEVAIPITERLAERCEVISVDYRLAPEHPFPAAIEDGSAVLQEAVATIAAAGQHRRLVLAGDSAGANVALSVALIHPDAVDGLALFSPHLEFDAELKPGSGSVNGGRSADPLSDVDDVAARWLSAAYRSDRDADDPAVAPALGELSGLPPTLVQVGSADGALGGSARFARRAKLANAEVTLDIWDGLWHSWQYHRELPEADRALAEAAEFICRQTSR